jgi:SAM-dependent methyltransferase
MERFGFDLAEEIYSTIGSGGNILSLSSECPHFSTILPADAGPKFTRRTVINGQGQEVPIGDVSAGQFDAVILDNVLQFVANPRLFISECFGKCKDGGQLMVVVPDQFFDDQVWQTPSRLAWESHAKRLYTPAALLMEIEEALAPASYRLKELRHGKHRANQGDRELTGLFLCVERIEGGTFLEPVVAAPGSAPPDLPIRDERSLFSAAESVQHYFTEFHHNLDHIGEVCVLKLDHRGDFVLANKAFSALRNLLPKARITLVCGSWNRPAAAETDFFDEVICFDAFPEDLSRMAGWTAPEQRVGEFETILAGRQFDLAIDLRTFTDTRMLLASVRAPLKVGFDPHNQFDWLTVRLPYVNQESMRPPIWISGQKFPAGHSGVQYFEQSMRLERGQYQLELLALADTRGIDVECVIIAQDGSRVPHANRIVSDSSFIPLVEFAVFKPVEDLRIMLSSQSKLNIFALNVVRTGTPGYINQAEAMLLLVYLTGMRLHTRLVLRDEELEGVAP